MTSHPLNNIAAVSFDLDDTLWDCGPAIMRAEEAVYLWLSQNYPHITERHSHADMHEMRMQIYNERTDLASDVTLMRKAFFHTIFSELPDTNSHVDAAFDFFYRERSRVELYEGTHDLLTSLSQNYKLAAITNGNADLELIGLADYFDDIQRATIDNPAKPAADMFVKCSSKLNIDLDNLIHVGDNPQTDVVGARNAGARTIWFNNIGAQWPEHLAPADFEVNSIAELQALLHKTLV